MLQLQVRTGHCSSVMLGYVAYSRAYEGKMKRPLRHFVQQWTPKQVAEKTGLLVSCLSMFKFAIDVYGNYHHLTHDMSVHIWFFLALAFKVGRIAIQGESTGSGLVSTQLQMNKALLSLEMFDPFFGCTYPGPFQFLVECLLTRRHPCTRSVWVRGQVHGQGVT